MINHSIFREYDIRGIVPEELNEKSVKLIGYLFGLEVINKNDKFKIVSVGYDARTHSKKMFEYLTSGLNCAGCEVYGMGMVSTGVNYFSTYKKFNNKQPHASIMITGSHNPSQYNGFKMTINNKPFFSDDIFLLRDKIKKYENMNIDTNTQFTYIDAKKVYVDWMTREFSHLKSMKEKFVIDCGNGVANTVLSDILDKLELNYDCLYGEPDGNFPNHHPDPSEEKNLIDVKKALGGNVSFAFAYDGDADRIAFLTKKYNVKGDILAILFASTMNKPTVVGEVKCTQLMYDRINQNGGKAIMYKTGHSNLKVKIQEVNASFAAEVSGHIFFNDRFFGFDDAIYATFRILELIKNNMNIDKEIDALPKMYSTEEIKINTTEENKFILMDKIKKYLKNVNNTFPNIKDIIYIDGIRIVFENGWGLVRASNTTPVLVTRYEASDKETMNCYKKNIEKLIEHAMIDI